MKNGRVKLEPTPNYHTEIRDGEVVSTTEPEEQEPEVILPEEGMEVTVLQRRGANAGKVVSKTIEPEPEPEPTKDETTASRKKE
jgi:hypothetical protein